MNDPNKVYVNIPHCNWESFKKTLGEINARMKTEKSVRATIVHQTDYYDQIELTRFRCRFFRRPFVAIAERIATVYGLEFMILPGLDELLFQDDIETAINMTDSKTGKFFIFEESVIHDSRELVAHSMEHIARFEGHTSFIRRAELLAELGSRIRCLQDPEFGSSEGVLIDGRLRWEIHCFLSWAIAHTRLTGAYISKKRGGEGLPTTAKEVLSLLKAPAYERYPELREVWESKVKQFTPTAEDRIDAQAVVNWAKRIRVDDRLANSYLANLNTIARLGYVEERTSGLAASMYQEFRKSRVYT